jgi:hypothetical protein
MKTNTSGRIIYACEEGEDYSSETLFSQRADAEQYRRLRLARGHVTEIVERVLDGNIEKYRGGLVQYRVIVRRDGSVRDICVSMTVLQESDHYNQTVADEWLFYVWARSAVLAEDEARARRVRLLAEGKWDVPKQVKAYRQRAKQKKEGGTK